jgi:hypothetical protein
LSSTVNRLPSTAIKNKMNYTDFQDIDELKFALKSLIVDDPDEALEELSKVMDMKSRQMNSLILYKSRKNTLNKEIQNGLISDDNKNVRQNQLQNSIMSFLDGLKEKDFNASILETVGKDIDTKEVFQPTIEPTEVNHKSIVALLIFPNDMSLGNLQEEERAIQSALLHFRKAGGNIEVITISSVDELFDYFNLYKGQIGLIHYGGHAESNGLFIDGNKANAKGLAELMGTEPNLEFVFLNGCATAGQVKLLQENNVKTVLATAVPVSDNKATNFAVHFYKSLAYAGSRSNLQEAFTRAKAYINTTETAPIEIATTRGFVLNDSEEITSFKWALYQNPKFENTLDWKLPKRGVNPNMSTKKLIDAKLAAVNTINDKLNNNNNGLSDIERAGLEKQVILLEKKIAFFDNKIIGGGLSADQEFAYLTQLEEMQAKLKEIKNKLK